LPLIGQALGSIGQGIPMVFDAIGKRGWRVGKPVLFSRDGPRPVERE
jgi:hypothetical protein